MATMIRIRSTLPIPVLETLTALAVALVILF
jgi:hypothetical protein